MFEKLVISFLLQTVLNSKPSQDEFILEELLNESFLLRLALK